MLGGQRGGLGHGRQLGQVALVPAVQGLFQLHGQGAHGDVLDVVGDGVEADGGVDVAQCAVDVGEALFPFELGSEGGGGGVDALELGTGIAGGAVGGGGVDALVNVVEVLGVLVAAQGLEVLLVADVDLDDGGDAEGLAPGAGDFDLGLAGFPDLGRGDEVKQVDGGPGAGLEPEVVEEEGVGVEVAADGDGEPGQDLEHLFPDIGTADALLVDLFPKVAAVEQAEVLEFGDGGLEFGRLGGDGGLGKAEVGVQRGVDEPGKLGLGDEEIAPELLKLVDDPKQAALVFEHAEDGLQAVAFNCPADCQGALGLDEDGLEPGQQALGDAGAPVGLEDFLDEVVDDFAAALLGDEDAVGLLLGLEVADAEVEDVPGEGEVGDAAAGVLGGGELALPKDVLAGVEVVFAGGAELALAELVAGVGGELGQHVEGGDLELGVLEHGFHERQPVVVVVLEGARQGIVEGQRPGQGLLLGVHLALVLHHGGQPLVRRHRHGVDTAAGQQQHGQ